MRLTLAGRLADGIRSASPPSYYTGDLKLVDFHLDRLQAAVERGGEGAPELVEFEGEPVAVVAIGGPTWHSRFTGCEVGRLDVCHLLTDDFDTLSALANWLRSTASERGYEMLSARTSAERHRMVAAASNAGWRHVGTTLKYVWQPLPKAGAKPRERQGVSLREATPRDLEALRRIIQEAHRASHFFNEPMWDRSVGHSIFSMWIEKALQGLAQRIIVAEHNGRVAGFVTLMEAKALIPYLGHAVAVLDFICVDRAVQGAGIGSALMDEAISWATSVAPALELRTMLDNHRASSWYQRLGFCLVAADHHYHVWT